MNRARTELFNLKTPINLIEILEPQNTIVSKKGLFKCRIVYQEEVGDISFTPYSLPSIATVRAVCSETIKYAYKYQDRSDLASLFLQRMGCDDILIIRKGLVTDTSYANVLFHNGQDWITPRFPLLEGTQRAYLLNKGKIKAESITLEQVKSFSKMRLINAMIRFEDELDIDVDHILE
jgi:4-amino-4-deoxychorismate lyase